MGRLTLKPMSPHHAPTRCVLLPGLKEGKALAIALLDDLLIMQLLINP